MSYDFLSSVPMTLTHTRVESCCFRKKLLAIEEIAFKESKTLLQPEVYLNDRSLQACGQRGLSPNFANGHRAHVAMGILKTFSNPVRTFHPSV